MAEGMNELPPVSPVVPYSVKWFIETVYREGGTLQTGRNGELTAAYPSGRDAVVAIRAALVRPAEEVPAPGPGQAPSQE